MRTRISLNIQQFILHMHGCFFQASVSSQRPPVGGVEGIRKIYVLLRASMSRLTYPYQVIPNVVLNIPRDQEFAIHCDKEVAVKPHGYSHAVCVSFSEKLWWGKVKTDTLPILRT